MLNRIFKNWKTTAVGIGILVCCFTLVAYGKASLTEMGLFYPAAIIFLLSKDKKSEL
jgi:hypothetical protein